MRTVISGLNFVILLGITVLGFSLLGILIRYLHQKLKKEQFEFLKTNAEMIVEAVEQLYGDGAGEDKKRVAVEFLMKKFKLSQQEAEFLVEYAVKQMKDIMNF